MKAVMLDSQKKVKKRTNLGFGFRGQRRSDPKYMPGQVQTGSSSVSALAPLADHDHEKNNRKAPCRGLAEPISCPCLWYEVNSPRVVILFFLFSFCFFL
jgi:hypothetical protein